MAALRILKAYNGSNACIQLESVYEHVFTDGEIQLHGTVYRKFQKFELHKNEDDIVGKRTMYIQLGIGSARGNSSTMWYNGSTWVAGNPTKFKVTVGNKDDLLYVRTGSSEPFSHYSCIEIPANMYLGGRIFLDLFGSDDIHLLPPLDVVGDDSTFDIVDFSLTYERNVWILKNPWGGQWGSLQTTSFERVDTREYTADNGNRSRDEWNTDCILASDNDMAFGFGVVINADNSYMTGFSYDGETDERPEQHLADRVAAFWTRSHRKLSMEVNRNNITQNYAPNTVYTFDGQNFMSTAIGYDWRNSIMTISIIDIDNSWT